MGDRKKNIQCNNNVFQAKDVICHDFGAFKFRALLGARRQDQMIRPSHQTSSMAACGCPETLETGASFGCFSITEENSQVEPDPTVEDAELPAERAAPCQLVEAPN